MRTPLLLAALALAVLAAACGDDAPGGPDAAADAGVPEPGAELVFDESQLRTYELTVADGDWTWLNEHALDEQYVPATLTFEGRTYANIGVRYKGGFGNLTLCFDQQGNRICPKLSMKLKFNEYAPDQRFHGLKRLNFHSMRSDPAAMRDRIAYGLYRAAGVPAPRSVHARLVVNGEALGLFALVEEIDGVFTRDRFGPATAGAPGGAADGDTGEGNLYKEIWPAYATPEPYLAALETNEDQSPSVDRMVRFAAALADPAAADEAGFRATLGAWMDVPTLVRYLAVDRFIDNWDGIVGWYQVNGVFINHNYFWYEETGRDRLWLVPWDMDNTFHVPSPIRSMYGMPDWDDTSAGCEPIPVFFGIPGRAPACDALLRRLVTFLWTDYEAATAELLAGPAAEAALAARVDFIEAQIAAAVTEDANGPGQAAWQQAVTQLRADLPTLRARVAP